MRVFRTDRIACVTALIGVGLMVLTIIWRVNPVEGSVVPRFLTDNPVGVAAISVLLVTCMPVWLPAVSLTLLMPLQDHAQWRLACGIMIVVQGIVYFLLGKLMSLIVRKLKARKTASDRTPPPAAGARGSG